MNDIFHTCEDFLLLSRTTPKKVANKSNLANIHLSKALFCKVMLTSDSQFGQDSTSSLICILIPQAWNMSFFFYLSTYFYAHSLTHSVDICRTSVMALQTCLFSMQVLISAGVCPVS